MSTGQPYNETELLRRIADGDQDAFSEFFRRYFDQLYLIMFKYTNRNIDAEDIVQAVFVKAWEKRQVFNEMEDPMSWFFVTARNEYQDRFRKSRLSRRYQQYLQEVFDQSDISPESILTNKEYANIYHQAISNLPEKQRMAYKLSRENGLTYDEIATEMKVEKSTVKEHIGRAIRSIRAFFLSQTGQTDDFLLFLLFFKLLSPSILYHSSLYI
ncbi:RNA polymerase sigma-70 factor [Flavitalea sp. BT771]|uniref:RNA polymerase sigma factor n=1 Tax=Flavitalea sp. BT771 TaxID=3063329 RepID=UPI0026E27587|nr:RNA polymerase sigma-70 factor [Flavitalea sp. BT771]MDO6430059.1 RNA polymerase sigma-70 factor [Flavitalea sp. BT771]MDV6219802.1 RNA polymerase sigma-70 factor [Flavitalea sp. BT771]